MTTTLHPLAEEYLERLERAASALPAPDRHELLTEIRGHLHAGLPEPAGDADVRNLLQELGRPEDIVAAARSESEPLAGPGPAVTRPPAATGSDSPWGVVEILAVLGLTVGMFLVPVVGPVVGIVLVWVSARWTRKEKWVATALTTLPVLAVVLAAGMFVVSGSSSTEDVRTPAPVVEESRP